ncbi:oxidative stress defense protein [Sodalis sp. dw_96]|uniref:oxidative stress defense protein n=1 Tax=Sodalis sp. dw_96 TaxID=2719794 RepID=UPI001BD32EC5|nr:oxidative stress defense protein [Sodalis sp. dw_96]
MKVKALALAAIVGWGVLSTQAPAAELPAGPHVITSGTASVEAVPDIATLTIVVSISSKDAGDAKNQADARVAQYFDFLAKSGVEKRDIFAANLLIQPDYDFLKTGESVLRGYRAVRQVQVTVRQLDKLNEILDGALKSGLNEIRAVEFGVANPGAYRDKALAQAMANATSQARALAAGFNTQLGPIFSIRYHVSNFQPMPVARMFKANDAMAQTDAAQTYAQQTIRFDDQVDVVFELRPQP